MEATPINLPPCSAVLRPSWRAAPGFEPGRRAELQPRRHMVEIFRIATQAAEEKRGAGMAEAMDCAAVCWVRIPRTARPRSTHAGWPFSLLISGRGDRARRPVAYVRNYLKEQKEEERQDPGQKTSGTEVPMQRNPQLWGCAQSPAGSACRVGSGRGGPAGERAGDKLVSKQGSGLDMGYLFGVGMAYLQAKQKAATGWIS